MLYRAFLLVFVLFLLVLFPIVGLQTATWTFSGRNVDPFGVFFTLMIVAAFLIAVGNSILLGYFFIWELAGKETIEIDDDNLKSRKTLFGRGPVREYKKEHIVSMRSNASAPARSSILFNLRGIFSGQLMGQIILTLSDGRIDYLGFGLSDMQAREVIKTIEELILVKNA